MTRTIIFTIAALALMGSFAAAQQVHCRTSGDTTVCQCYGKC